MWSWLNIKTGNADFKTDVFLLYGKVTLPALE